MLNIRNFNTNINKCNIFMDTLISKPDILVLSETLFIDTDNPSIYLKDYNMYKTNRKLQIKKKVGSCNFCTH